jgi:hypothetical protein
MLLKKKEEFETFFPDGIEKLQKKVNFSLASFMQ